MNRSNAKSPRACARDLPRQMLPRELWRNLPWRKALPFAIPAALAAGLVGIGYHQPAQAVPAFAAQTGLACSACHVGGFGPQLTPFGREFKLGGYTMRSRKSIPLSGMAVASLTHTSKDQVPPPDNLDSNNNLVLDQASIFVAGGIGKHFGIFSQTTYDGVGQAWAWDNTDIRAVTRGNLFGQDTVFGLSLNNGPTVQDVWNTTPAWGFPYTDTAVSDGPGYAPLIDDGLATESIGLTAYAWIGHHYYLEAGGYSTPAAGTLNWLGADPAGGPGNISGIAPYARVAWQGNAAKGTLELGAFLLDARIHPDRIDTINYVDHYSDVGVDASWQRQLSDNSVISAQARYVHENGNYRASCALGLIGSGNTPGCADVGLDELRGDFAYHWHNKVGATVGLFSISGDRNDALYGPSGSPDSNGVMLQLDYSPWGNGNGPLGRQVNLQVGIQYTAYGKFDGARHNYDGAGANASDNNALRVYTWLAF